MSLTTPGVTYDGTGYPNALNLNSKKPFDVRQVVDTLADRNLLQYTYPTMLVSVRGNMVLVGGVPTYPYQSAWRCLVDREPSFGGPTTNDGDWVRDDAPASLTTGAYKGPWDASTNTPDLTDAALLAALKPGDYYRTSKPGNTSLNGASSWALNDSAFWDGSRWDKFENTNPVAVNPLYADTEGPRFQSDVKDLVRLNALTEWAAGTAYKANTWVKSTYQESGNTYVDTYQAVGAMNAASAALPTPTTPNPNWQLISTTNFGRLTLPALTARQVYDRLEGDGTIFISLTDHNTVLLSLNAPGSNGTSNHYVQPGYAQSGYVD